MNILQAKKIMGKNFIGLDELKKISYKLKFFDPYKYKIIPIIPFSVDKLKKASRDYILILGISKAKDGRKLTINTMRSMFGLDPRRKEPCFYNQDWYLKEKFASVTSLKFKWYLVRKKVIKETRGQDPGNIQKNLEFKQYFPLAVLTVFTFFAYYFHTNGKILWRHDFIWCSDKDKNGDRIYTGRYIDPQKINKNGFNIHRHLSIRHCHGLAPQIL